MTYCKRHHQYSQSRYIPAGYDGHGHYHGGGYRDVCPACLTAAQEISSTSTSPSAYPTSDDSASTFTMPTFDSTPSYDPPSIPDSTPDTSSFDFGGGGGFSGGGGGDSW